MEIPSMIIPGIAALILVLGLGGYMIYDNNDSITESDVLDIVLDNQPVIPEYKDTLCHKDSSCVKWLNENYAFKGIAAKNDKDLDLIAKEISSIRTEMATLSAQLAKQKNTPVNTQSTSCLTSTMNLSTSSSDPSDIKSNFLRGDIIYITGETADASSNKIKIINKSTNQVIEESTFNASSSGVFTRAHITDNDSDKGRYTIQIERGSVKSCIGFSLS